MVGGGLPPAVCAAPPQPPSSCLTPCSSPTPLPHPCTAGHYPDQLLAPRASALRALYRAPFDFLEQVTTGLADGVLVNSLFTQAAFLRTFALLAAGGLRPSVLYPCIAIHPSPPPPPPPPPALRVMLSINRFERKKLIGTAVRAFAAALAAAPPQRAAQWHLVVAGGYDTRVEENVAHFEELCALAAGLGLVGGGGAHARAPGRAPAPGPAGGL